MNDLRFAIRQLGRNPGFTAVAVLVLGLGIGANTAMFSIINTLLFKPVVAAQPEALARVFSKDSKPEGGFRSFSYPNYNDIRAMNTGFAELAAFTTSLAGVTEDDATRRVFAQSVSANYLRTFGVRPALGRDFLSEEERPGAGIAVAIVSHGFWKSRGADPALVGQTLTLNGRPFEVVGVTPAGFSGTTALFSPDVLVPLGVHEWLANDFRREQGRRLSDRENHALMLVGCLRPGVNFADAETRLQPVAARLAEAYPKENQDQTFVVRAPARLSLNTGPQNETEIRALAALLLPMSGIVLFIACLNLANMLLARGAARQKEFAIRAALGGGRPRIIRQMLTEGFVLSLLGGAIALPVSAWVTGLLAHSLEGKLPFMRLVFDVRPDGRVLAATFGFCVLAMLLSNLVPAWRLSRVDVMQDFKHQGSDGRGGLRGFGPLSARGLLVTAQVALSFALLTVAGLFFRGALNAAQADPGFRFEQGILAEFDSSLAGYDEPKARAVYAAALERVRRLPGVERASLASSVAFGIFGDGRLVHRPGASHTLRQGRTLPEQDGAFYANYVIVSDDYFASLGTAMLRGREFDRLEVAGASRAPVAIINEVTAKRLWPDGDAVGRQIEIVDTDPAHEPLVLEVVGMAPGFRAQLGDAEPTPHLYVPIGQAFQAWMNLHVRLASADAVAEKAMLGTVRAALREADPKLPILSVNTLSDFHNEGVVMWMFRAGTRLFITFALLALALAVVGVYGLKAFVVARRTREIGIRIALGATKGQVLWMVLRDGLKLLGSGLGVGLVLALAAGQLLRSTLYHVNGADPTSLGAAMAVLTLAGLLAAYLPARRAAAVQPVTALRTD